MPAIIARPQATWPRAGSPLLAGRNAQRIDPASPLALSSPTRRQTGTDSFIPSRENSALHPAKQDALGHTNVAGQPSSSTRGALSPQRHTSASPSPASWQATPVQMIAPTSTPGASTHTSVSHLVLPPSPTRFPKQTRHEHSPGHSPGRASSRRVRSSSASPPARQLHPETYQIRVQDVRPVLGGGGSDVGSIHGVSARSIRSGRSSRSRSVPRTYPPSLVEPPSVAATAATQICGELRWLRENSVVVSNYDAVLNSKVERMHRLQKDREFRKAQQSKFEVKARFRDAKFWMITKLCERTGRLMLATMVAGWRELTFRPQGIEVVVLQACRTYIQFFCLFAWRRGIGQQHCETTLGKLRLEMGRLREAERLEMENVRARHSKIQMHYGQKILESLGRTLGTHDAFILPTILHAWYRVSRSKHAGQKKLSGVSIIQMQNFCMEAAVLKTWRSVVREKMKAVRVNTVLVKALLVLHGSTEKDLIKVVFDSWVWCVSQGKRRASFSFEHQDSILNKLGSMKAQSRAIRVKYAEHSMKVFTELTDTGLASKTFKAWSNKTGQLLAEQRLVWLQQQLQAVDLRRNCRNWAIRLSMLRDLEMLESSGVWLLFVTWSRAALEGERERLRDILDEHGSISATLQAVQKQVRIQMKVGAASIIAGHLGNQIRISQHQALAQLSLGAKNSTLAQLRQGEVRQRETTSGEDKQNLGAMRVHARYQRHAAAHFGSIFIASWCANLYRVFLHIWSTIVAETSITRRWENWLSVLEAHRTQLKAASRVGNVKRQAAVAKMLSVFDASECQRVWNGWARLRVVSRAAAAREDQRQAIEAETVFLCSSILEKKVLVEWTMLSWATETIAVSSKARLRMLRILSHEWIAAAAFSKLWKKRREHSVAGQKMAFVLLHAEAVASDSLLIRRAAMSWQVLANVSRLARERQHSVWLQGARLSTSSRLRRCVRAVTGLLENRQDFDFCLRAFLEWRRLFAVKVIDRTGTEVRLALDERVNRSRRTLVAERASLDKAFAVSHSWIRGHLCAGEIVARLCFPAWWLFTKNEHRRRLTLIGEERQLTKLEGLQRHAAGYCSRWSRWVAICFFFMWNYRWAELVLRSWHLAASTRAAERRRWNRARRFSAASEKVFARSNKFRWRVFAAWQRVQVQATRAVLEGRLRELEDLFVRKRGGGSRGAALKELQELEEESSSDESDDDASDFEGLGTSSDHFTFYDPSKRSTLDSSNMLPESVEPREGDGLSEQLATADLSVSQNIFDLDPVLQIASAGVGPAGQPAIADFAVKKSGIFDPDPVIQTAGFVPGLDEQIGSANASEIWDGQSSAHKSDSKSSERISAEKSTGRSTAGLFEGSSGRKSTGRGSARIVDGGADATHTHLALVAEEVLSSTGVESENLSAALKDWVQESEQPIPRSSQPSMANFSSGADTAFEIQENAIGREAARSLRVADAETRQADTKRPTVEEFRREKLQRERMETANPALAGGTYVFEQARSSLQPANTSLPGSLLAQALARGPEEPLSDQPRRNLLPRSTLPSSLSAQALTPSPYPWSQRLSLAQWASKPSQVGMRTG